MGPSAEQEWESREGGPFMLPEKALRLANRVLIWGMKKHGSADKWRTHPPGYHARKAVEHLQAWMNGRELDEESGHSNLAHAACRILFLLTLAVPWEYDR